MIMFCYLTDECQNRGDCSYWTVEEQVLGKQQVFDCSLLSSCHLQQNLTSYPTVTTSGSKTCVPEIFKRRPCLPGCRPHAPYCHGRCVFGGRKCFFHPCSRSPYREDAGKVCADFIHDLIEEENDGCKESCSDLSTESGEAECQSCLMENVPEQCRQMSGSSCYKCSIPVLEGLEVCSEIHQDVLNIIQCVKERQSPSCQQCTCTVLCYESPDSDHCRACLHQPELATLFVNHEFCQQVLKTSGLFIDSLLPTTEIIRVGSGQLSPQSATKDSPVPTPGWLQKPPARMAVASWLNI